MTNEIQKLWNDQHAVADFTQAEQLQEKTTKFERTVRNRNLVEFTALTVVFALFVGGAVLSISGQAWPFVAAFAAGAIGTLYVAWSLFKRGTNLHRQLEVDCVTHLSQQYRRQIDLLRSVPRWYLAPFIPGIAGIFLAVALGAAPTLGWAATIDQLVQPVAIIVAVFGLVAWINLFSASKLEKKLTEILSD